MNGFELYDSFDGEFIDYHQETVQHDEQILNPNHREFMEILENE